MAACYHDTPGWKIILVIFQKHKYKGYECIGMKVFQAVRKGIMGIYLEGKSFWDGVWVNDIVRGKGICHFRSSS